MSETEAFSDDPRREGEWVMDKHALVRTNPKGQEFIGRCLKCGKDNLPISAMREDCPNPSGITEEQTLMKVMRKDG